MGRTLLLGAACLFPAAASADPVAERAKVETIVESVAVLADRGEFDALARLFDDEITVDYESLSGSPADVRSPSGLMSDWAALLPGFDATRHDLSDVAALVEGSVATASADVTATHWIGADSWAVDGRYDYALERGAEGWRITAMTFTLEEERGDRALTARALQAAGADPAPYLRRARARTVVRQFLQGLETLNMEAVNAVWAEDAVLEMPFAPRGVGFPDRVVGKDALIRQYAAWPDTAIDPDYTSGLRFLPTVDPDTVVAEFRGRVTIRPTGRFYDQRYIGVFHIDEDGKIALFREYFDPTVFTEAFGLAGTGED
ncbi:MAG: nuclear transport factor 2 family protein [Pseudomonadota bacterium]